MRLAGEQLRLPGEPVAVAVSRPLETAHHQHAASPAPPASRCNLFYAAAHLALHPLQLALLRTGHLLRVSLGPSAAATSVPINTYLGAAPTLDLTTSPRTALHACAHWSWSSRPSVYLEALPSKVHHNTTFA